jgi:hypothetical protein
MLASLTSSAIITLVTAGQISLGLKSSIGGVLPPRRSMHRGYEFLLNNRFMHMQFHPRFCFRMML